MFLAFIATVYLHEPLKIIEWAGILISGTGVLGLTVFTTTNEPKNLSASIELLLLIISTVIIAGSVLISRVSLRYYFLKPGLLEGLTGGIVGGLPSLLAKIAISRAAQLDVLHWSIIMLVITQGLAFYFLQRGFHVGHIAVVASLFTATSIIIPVSIAFFLFDETLHMLQIVGIMLIIMGAIFFSQRTQEIEQKYRKS
jgi:drug/metabolite transporter (DMT)-like permease